MHARTDTQAHARTEHARRLWQQRSARRAVAAVLTSTLEGTGEYSTGYGVPASSLRGTGYRRVLYGVRGTGEYSRRLWQQRSAHGAVAAVLVRGEFTVTLSLAHRLCLWLGEACVQEVLSSTPISTQSTPVSTQSPQ